MSSGTNRARGAQHGLSLGVLNPVNDGFGGVSAGMFPSPVETLPETPTDLPSIAMDGGYGPTMPFGNMGMGNEAQGGRMVHGATELECQGTGCGYSTTDPRDMSAHYARGGCRMKR